MLVCDAGLILSQHRMSVSCLLGSFFNRPPSPVFVTDAASTSAEPPRSADLSAGRSDVSGRIDPHFGRRHQYAVRMYLYSEWITTQPQPETFLQRCLPVFLWRRYVLATVEALPCWLLKC